MHWSSSRPRRRIRENRRPFKKRVLSGKGRESAKTLQNQVLSEFRRLANGARLYPVKGKNNSGTNYVHIPQGRKADKIRIDERVSFGAMGEGVINVRAKGEQLLNSSDWMFIHNRNRTLTIIPTATVRSYVAEHWATLSEKARQKSSYALVPIALKELIQSTETRPVTIKLELTKIVEALRQIRGEQTAVTSAQRYARGLPPTTAQVQRMLSTQRRGVLGHQSILPKYDLSVFNERKPAPVETKTSQKPTAVDQKRKKQEEARAAEVKTIRARGKSSKKIAPGKGWQIPAPKRRNFWGPGRRMINRKPN